MDEQKWAKLLLNVVVDDPDESTLPTSSCPPLPRLRAAVLRENWTAAEQTHKQTCAYCQRAATQVQNVLWHPTLVELFGHGRARQEHVAYHLEHDDCKHCHRLREALAGNRLLRRLSGERLNQFLGSGIAGKTVEVEGGKEPRLVQVVAGGSEQFVLVRAGEKVSFCGAAVTVFEVQAGVLAAADLPLLRAAGKGKERDYNEWAARALRGTKLEGKVREEMMKTMRAGQVR
jgi:hypothetical protein